MRRARLGVACLLAGVAACQTQKIVTPTRSLDRPSDVAMVCARGTGGNGNLEVRPLAECSNVNAFGFGTQPLQLYLLVSGSTRGELAGVFTGHPGPDMGTDPNAQSTQTTATILDLDPNTPGYGFLPVGGLPQPLRASDDGTWAVTANRGTCDFAVVDVATVLRSGTGDTSIVGIPSKAVTRVAARVGGRALAARPTWVEMSAPQTGGGACTSGRCVVAALPACELVAEIDLAAPAGAATNITQALHVGRDGIRPVDPASIACPEECTTTGAGASPDLAMNDDMAAPGGDDMAMPTDGGVGAGDLPPILPTDQAYPHVLAIDYGGWLPGADGGVAPSGRTLIIGDAVSPRIVFVSLDAASRFGAVSTVTLSGTAQGVERLRVSPPIPELQDPQVHTVAPRFVYAIARDRTVRVVDVGRGVECETNPANEAVQAIATARVPNGLIDDLRHDPSTTPWQTERALSCLPVGSTPRNPLALSAGILLPGGSLPRDVVFMHAAQLPVPAAGQPAPAAQPPVLYGWFAWIIDSAGRTETVTLADLCPAPNVADLKSPQGDGSVACVPARFGKLSSEGVSFDAVPAPSVFDVLPHRIRSQNYRWATASQGGNTPSHGPVRLQSLPVAAIAGVALDIADPATAAVSTALCNVAASGKGCTALPTSATMTDWNYLGVTNPNQVSNETWSVVWEGLLPGTLRSTAGVYGDTVTDPNGAYCARGVHAGDRLFLNGCRDDSACGPDQYCYLSPNLTVGAPGICLDRPSGGGGTTLKSTDDSSNGACNDWTRGLLRYRITDVRQRPGGSELKIEELYLPEHFIDAPTCTADADCEGAPVATTRGSNETIVLPTKCLPDGHGARRCFVACDPTGSSRFKCGGTGGDCASNECGSGFVCAPSSLGDNRCLRAPLPPVGGAACGNGQPACPRGTACTNGKCAGVCFKELQAYEIHGGDAFIARGDVNGFLHAEYPDPTTGACVLPAANSPDRLRTGRIPLEAPACPASLQMSWLGPLPADAPAVCTLDLGDGARYLRYQNPVFAFVLRVPARVIRADGSASSCGADGGTCNPFPGTDGGVLPSAIERVPEEGASETFQIIGGFRPMSFPLASDVLAQMPRAAVMAPDGVSMYVVDQGLQQSPAGLRGQVIRFYADTQSSDSLFQVR